ncbi:MAG: ABC transporter permease subunit [Pseudomonadota bacterium]|nr:ABC transporter permease subunit [Pseudomonadota bacterium]
MALLNPIMRKRFRKFKTIKRGYYSFLILLITYVMSLGAELFVNNKPLVLYYNGEYYFPVVKFYAGETFGADYIAEAQYKELEKSEAFKSNPDNVMLFPLIPFGYNESDNQLSGSPPTTPDSRHWLGTDDRGRDLLARLIYGYRVSMSLAFIIFIISYIIGIFVGGLQGYFGGVIDLSFQRLIEVFSAIPFLPVLMLLASVFEPSILLLVVVFGLYRWIGVSYYMRAEFLRARKVEYVESAKSVGASSVAIMGRHILPNTITPLVTIAPFAISSSIILLSSLDFLGFGVPAPTASWGEVLSQATSNLTSYHLSVFPAVCLFVTLLLVSFVGEAVREAFDPKPYFRHKG